MSEPVTQKLTSDFSQHVPQFPTSREGIHVWAMCPYIGITPSTHSDKGTSRVEDLCPWAVFSIRTTTTASSSTDGINVNTGDPTTPRTQREQPEKQQWTINSARFLSSATFGRVVESLPYCRHHYCETSTPSQSRTLIDSLCRSSNDPETRPPRTAFM